MSYIKPAIDSRWIRRKDGTPVIVRGCTGSEGTSTVLVFAASTNRHAHVQLAWFHRRYEADGGEP